MSSSAANPTRMDPLPCSVRKTCVDAWIGWDLTSSQDREFGGRDSRHLARDELPVHPDGSLAGLPVAGDLQRREPILTGAQREIFRRVGALSGEFLEGPEFILAGADLVEQIQERSSHREPQEFHQAHKTPSMALV